MISNPTAQVVDGTYEEENKEEKKGAKLLAWLQTRLDPWRDHRQTTYEDKWHEYYRIWRGIWAAEDKTRDSERSRLISPATQQAIEATVAELEEATFGRGQWFDIQDDPLDKEKGDVEQIKNNLLYDLEQNKVKSAISEAYLNAALYGTGICEILIDESIKKVPQEKEIQPGVTARGVVEQPYISCKWKAISPFNFLIDPNATTVEESIGVGIETKESIHSIIPRIQDGTYFDVDIGGFSNKDELLFEDDNSQNDNSDYVKITKYYGLVPLDLLDELNKDSSEEEEGDTDLSEDTDIDSDDILVEAIVVIANDDILLKAIQSPYMLQDRPVIAFSLDKIPNRFWGRGVAEKGYNPQKALDTELRARIDALALTTHPMMAMDATRLPRGAKFNVRPGQTLMSNGDPREVFMPFTFGQLSPTNFQATADFERMVQMSTGAIDTAMPVGGSPRNATASGMSMMMGASIKRQKRTLLNIQDNFLVPGIYKTAIRYMQFDPTRYPAKDLTFLPATTMGIMAREYEQQQFIQLLSMAPQGSPLFMLLMKSIYENSSLSHREEAIQMLTQMMQPPPPDPVQQQMMQLDMADKQKTVEYKQAQIQQLIGQLQLEEQKLQLDAQLATMDKSPKDPIEIELKLREMQLKEAELHHRMQKEVAELAQKDTELYIKNKEKDKKDLTNS